MTKQSISIQTKPKLDTIAKVFKTSQKKKMSNGIGAIVLRVSHNIASETPMKTKKLINSQKFQKRGDLDWEFTESVPYGAILRAGVTPQRRNPILPVNKKALANRVDNFGPVAAVYNHPGIKKNDYWTRGIDKSDGDIKRESEKAGIDIAAEYKF